MLGCTLVLLSRLRLPLQHGTNECPTADRCKHAEMSSLHFGAVRSRESLRMTELRLDVKIGFASGGRHNSWFPRFEVQVGGGGAFF